MTSIKEQLEQWWADWNVELRMFHEAHKLCRPVINDNKEGEDNG